MREKKTKRRRSARREEAAAGAMLSSTTDNFQVDSGISPKAGTSKVQSQGAPADASPDSKCPICLDRFDNVSHLDRCLHRFCFRCIQEWAKNKAECPLCKQPFNSIFHSIRAEDDFKEYILRPTLNGSSRSPDGRRFRYRTTMTRNNVAGRILRSSRRTYTPPDPLFEGLSSIYSHQRGSNIGDMMHRLAIRRQANTEGRATRQIEEQDLINFRRSLYRAGLRVRNIQDGGRYRDISAEFFRRNPACLHRLVPWLKRELTVLFGSHRPLVDIVQHIIMRNVKVYDMESHAFLDELQPFLLHRTDHFIHEFISFSRCPYNIEAYDHHANYDCPAPSYEEESRSESSVITISPDEVNTREAAVPSSSLDVGQTPWDDETPGPSYTSVDQTVSWTANISDEQPSSSIQTTSDAENATEDVQAKAVCPEECVIVGFVKPLAERTPELVELSSDSEGSLCEVKIEQTKKPQIKPLALVDFSGSRKSCGWSFLSSDTNTWLCGDNLIRGMEETSPFKKTKEHKRKEAASRSVLGSRKDKKRSHNNELSRHRARSKSSDCYSRSSQNKAYERRSRRRQKNTPRRKKSPEKSRHRSWREKRKSRSRERSSSWRSQTVSLTSESSRERRRSCSTSRNRSRERSLSRDSDDDYAADNYRSTYQWEYTYYSRNQGKDAYEQSFRKDPPSKGRYYRPSPEYRMLSYTSKRELKRKKGTASTRHHNVRYRSRSRSRSRTNTSGASFQLDKPGGKRKYKTRHLERQEEKANNQELEATQGNAKSYKDDLTETSSNEPKRRKNTRSPSVEIVYEGKATESSKYQKKKKRKHKKRRHEQLANSAAASPIIITINSDSDMPTVEETSPSDRNTPIPAKSHDQDIAVPAHSRSTSTSTIVDITEPVSKEPASPSSKDDDLFSSNGHLDAATGILDGLHFDDSSDEPALPATSSPTEIEPQHDEEAAMAQFSLSDSKSEQETAASTTPTFLLDSQENLSENAHIFAETISELLESITAPPVL